MCLGLSPLFPSSLTCPILNRSLLLTILKCWLSQTMPCWHSLASFWWSHSCFCSPFSDCCVCCVSADSKVKLTHCAGGFGLFSLSSLLLFRYGNHSCFCFIYVLHKFYYNHRGCFSDLGFNMFVLFLRCNIAYFILLLYCQ